MGVEWKQMVVTGAYRPVRRTACQQQLLARRQGSGVDDHWQSARGHGDPPPEGLDPFVISAATVHHHDPGQAGHGTQMVKQSKCYLMTNAHLAFHRIIVPLIPSG